MAGSLRRWGQLAPVVACVRASRLEVLDGFKRWAAAKRLVNWRSLSVRVLEVDEPTAKAAILALNRDQRSVRELEEAWVVQGLVREDGMTQVQAAHLLGRHKSWVCRRLALLERLSVAVKEDLRLGLLGPALARQLTRLPAGNQQAVLALTRRETLTAQEVSGVIELLQGASPEQAAFVLEKPREALAQAQREGRTAPAPGPRQSIIAPFEPLLQELLAQYPNLTVERALQELRDRGFTGGYTVVRQRVRLLRPGAAPVPVPRFETGPGQ